LFVEGKKPSDTKMSRCFATMPACNGDQEGSDGE